MDLYRTSTVTYYQLYKYSSTGVQIKLIQFTTGLQNRLSPSPNLPHLKVDATHIDPAYQDDGLLPLRRLGLGLLVGEGLLHQDDLDALLHGVPGVITN